jgi:pimeloyl-ACP methyl ester carboxylesterase
VIEPLIDPVRHGGSASDCFDVIVPSLPGFGFSTPLTRPGPTFWEVADLWSELMTRLGYDRFGAFGCDFGAWVTAQLGHKYAPRMIGVHMNYFTRLDIWERERPWNLLGPAPYEATPDVRQAMFEFERSKAVHLAENVLAPQSIAYAMHDSPTGMCAWLLERRRAWSDCGGDVESAFSKDELLTAMTIYWATESFAGAGRFYSENARRPWQPSHDRTPVVEAPTAISTFLADALPVRRGADDYFNLQFTNEWARGGHFPPAEAPAAVVADLRAGFRPLR